VLCPEEKGHKKVDRRRQGPRMGDLLVTFSEWLVSLASAFQPVKVRLSDYTELNRLYVCSNENVLT
jgi:hypothetical protein